MVMLAATIVVGLLMPIKVFLLRVCLWLVLVLVRPLSAGWRTLHLTRAACEDRVMTSSP